MKRILPVSRPYPGGKMGIIAPMTMFNRQSVVIQPGESAEIDFWDEIKDNKIYQNYLDRGFITVGEDDTLERGGTEPYTSFGDTMVAADSLNPEIDDEAAEAVNMELDREVERPKKKGRRGRAQIEAEKAAESAVSGKQNVEQN